MHRYSAQIVWSDEDEGFIATIPEFPTLSAFGETPAEALDEAHTALEGFLQIYEEDGLPLPEPRKCQAYSGQLWLRMPRSLHRRLAGQAESEGVSLNQWLVSLLSEGSGYKRGAKAAEHQDRVIEIHRALGSRRVSILPCELLCSDANLSSRSVAEETPTYSFFHAAAETSASAWDAGQGRIKRKEEVHG